MPMIRECIIITRSDVATQPPRTTLDDLLSQAERADTPVLLCPEPTSRTIAPSPRRPTATRRTSPATAAAEPFSWEIDSPLPCQASQARAAKVECSR